jgi:hypothetical protein
MNQYALVVSPSRRNMLRIYYLFWRIVLPDIVNSVIPNLIIKYGSLSGTIPVRIDRGW